ncbi:MAG TPA: DNA methyltransferase, partial [Stellaceae bacterium]|nr:DNA methyltransferase [Stellaceae bacterium]
RNGINRLFYGDNLDILRRKIKDESVDLCYIDPPFNSKRNYNQIYNNIGGEDRAQAHAFTDTWIWDDHAIAGFDEILANAEGRFTAKLVELIKGLHSVLGEGSLLAYLISMALRATEIQRVLKQSGSFYLHCDPTAGHYLKILLDAVFCPHGGEYRNEIIWCYRKWSVAAGQFVSNHDNIHFYTKSRANSTFNVLYGAPSPGTMKRWKGEKQQAVFEDGVRKATSIKGEQAKSPMPDWWDISIINPNADERQGYQTQKPEALLERVISASSNEGDTVLDAYCGCGTTVAVAQRLKRKWIGMDITYQSIAVVLRRLEKTYGPKIFNNITTDGIPRDMKSAEALAHKKDDRLRKEFEKWAVLTYTNNRAIINDKKGADAGIDGVAYFKTGKTDNAKIVFQVKSGGVNRGDIATLRGDMEREKASLAVLITLEEPSAPMKAEAKGAGHFKLEDMPKPYDKISIVTVKEIVEDEKRLEIPMSLEVLRAAKKADESEQLGLL